MSPLKIAIASQTVRVPAPASKVLCVKRGQYGLESITAGLVGDMGCIGITGSNSEGIQMVTAILHEGGRSQKILYKFKLSVPYQL